MSAESAHYTLDRIERRLVWLIDSALKHKDATQLSYIESKVMSEIDQIRREAPSQALPSIDATRDIIFTALRANRVSSHVQAVFATARSVSRTTGKPDGGVDPPGSTLDSTVDSTSGEADTTLQGRTASHDRHTDGATANSSSYMNASAPESGFGSQKKPGQPGDSGVYHQRQQRSTPMTMTGRQSNHTASSAKRLCKPNRSARSASPRSSVHATPTLVAVHAKIRTFALLLKMAINRQYTVTELQAQRDRISLLAWSGRDEAGSGITIVSWAVVLWSWASHRVVFFSVCTVARRTGIGNLFTATLFPYPSPPAFRLSSNRWRCPTSHYQVALCQLIYCCCKSGCWQHMLMYTVRTKKRRLMVPTDTHMERQLLGESKGCTNLAISRADDIVQVEQTVC